MDMEDRKGEDGRKTATKREVRFVLFITTWSDMNVGLKYTLGLGLQQPSQKKCPVFKL